ncbi:arylamine N-acetyltransferase [Streptomyces sp. NPDC003280]|uniref:arylamine N-acetyltransferase family protein n=1 Tax=Streptomyces sp. NPDC003280 TaxID=3364680 RepID=UPI0036A22D56
MNSAQADAYLRRIEAARPRRPTAEALRDLHLRHLRTVPFENLSIHLGEEIVLEEERLLDKVVGRRRGGFCYELNGAFGALLTALGYEVALLAGRVYGNEGRLGIPYDHLALRVRTADGADWLADVGFGAHSHFPLALAERGGQADLSGTYRVREAGPDPAGVTGAAADRAAATGGRAAANGAGAGPAGGADLDVLRDGRAQYRLETRPRALADFTGGAWWHSTSPHSHFTRSLVCSRVNDDAGRITLSGRALTLTTPIGEKETRELGTDEEVLAVYRERFGIELAAVPAVRQPSRTD